MAILHAILLAITRRVGQLVNTLFGWATQLLFGKTPRDKQIFLSGMAFGSVAWLISLLGIIVPSVGTFLFAFIPLPEWVDRNWVRILMLAMALVLPLIVGTFGLMAFAPEERPRTTGEKVKAVLRGYPYTLGMAVTLILMILFAPFRILPLMVKRWTTDHVPLIVEAEEYEIILTEVEATLKASGWQVSRQPAHWMIRLPTRILVSLANQLIDKYVADNLTTLTAEKLTVTLHPADLVLSGEKFEVVRVRALLTEHLAFSRANQTWTKEGNELENQVTAIWQQIEARTLDTGIARQQLAEIKQKRDHMNIEFEEWTVLERQQLLVERYLLEKVLIGGAKEPGLSEPEAGIKTEPLPTSKKEKPPRPLDLLIGATVLSGLALLGLRRSTPQKEQPAS